MERSYNFARWLNRWLKEELHLEGQWVGYIKLAILLVVLFILSALVWWLTKRVMVTVLHRIFKKTKATWDDKLIERGVFDKLAHIAPAIVVNFAAPYVFGDFPNLIPAVMVITDLFIIAVVIWSVNAMLTALADILSETKVLKDKPVASYAQLGKIIVFLVGGVLIFSLLIGKSPLTILGAMGAMTAVLLLIFKDSIMGFVASIQISVYDMVRVGDWISMPKFDADGDVIAINLTTVMVQNWDRTITTIPTYALISDSFKNWRGMSNSGGRRIKRAVHIKISSIRFVDEELLNRFRKFQRLNDFLDRREAEIAAYNKEHGVDKSELVNGRHMTNIGVFRQYVLRYLEMHPKLNHEMTTMVRQLDPTEKGLPLEIYCFSSDKNWVTYEGIISDIFDHLFAAIPSFDLEVFEIPTGKDFQSMTSAARQES